MKGITIEKDTIVYYGNAAGYVSGNKAIVDPLFESQEMQDFLNRQKDISEVKWVDGVFDRLSNGQKETHELTLLKNCRIWQLRPGAAVWKDIVSFGKPLPEPALEDYAVVYDGQLDSNDLEAIYDKFTERRPPGFSGHPMSVSDLVELYDSGGSAFYYLDRTCFRQVELSQPEQGFEMTMTP